MLSENIIKAAIEYAASDIHFYPTSEVTTIYFRIHGQRQHQQIITIDQYDLLLSYFKFTAGMDIGEVRKPQSGVIIHYQNNISYSLILSTLPTHKRESLAIRVLPHHTNLSLKLLFLFQNQTNILHEWIQERSGYILFTGPTGSGKSTTLYALLQHILQQEKAYQTITHEDPGEQQLPHALQVQINEEAGMGYDEVLKEDLSYDIDIIMIGDIYTLSKSRII